MDSTVAIVILAILTLVVVIVVVFKISEEPSTRPKTKSQQRDEVMARFEKRLDKALTPLKGDKTALHAAKTKCLKQFSEELAMNIMFDADDKREMIRELAAYQV